MTSVNTCQLEPSFVSTPHGKLFAQRFIPATVQHAIPIVLLHDSLGSITLWRDIPHQLAVATGRVVIAYDRLGFGQSDAYGRAIPLDFVHQEGNRAFKAVLDHFAIDQFVAFGHSVGGGMTLAIAASYPQRCAAAITEAAQTHLEEFTLNGVRSAKEMFSKPGQLERLAKYHGDKAKWVLDSWIESWLSPEFASWNLDAELAAIQCPVLCLHGENDEFGTERHPLYVQEKVGGLVTVALLPGLGHVPHKEAPDVVLARVNEFLARI